MDIFFYNIIISLWTFGSWYITGLGPAFILLPKHQKQIAVFLAPVLGMCLLTLIGLWQITVLLTPLTPLLNISFLAGLSILLLLWRHKNIKISKKSFSLILIPLLFLFIFTLIFHAEGFHLIVGGSDQLQYCQNARHILEDMHTGSMRDVPVPRQDHYIYDMCTTMMPYIKTYRRGAEVLLATVTAFTGLTFEESFPITVLCALLTLSFGLAVLSRVFLRLSLGLTILLQITFLSSFYLLLLHVQGSLALLTGLAPGLLTLAFLTRAVSISSPKWILLASIVTGGYLSIYSEPALVNIILPLILFLILKLTHSWQAGISAIRRFLIIFIIISLFAPYTVYSVFFNLIYNITPIYSNLLKIFANSAGIKTSSLSITNMSWDVTSVILGLVSYYDNSVANIKISLLLTKFSWSKLIFLFLLSGCALLGYLKRKNYLQILFAFILTLWIFASIILALQQDSLRFTRSLHYAMPYIMIGLILFTKNSFQLYSKKTVLNTLGTWTSKIILISFILVNCFTVGRTIHFLIAYNVQNDPILLRFNEKDPYWQSLKAELNHSAVKDIPVLISSFKEVIRPIAIANIIRIQPHVLGNSMSFWPIYSTEVPANKLWSELNTRLSENQLKAIQNQDGQLWSKMLPDYFNKSEQAVIPVNSTYPSEWEVSDIYSPLRKHFPNVCDVVYRKKFAIALNDSMVSALKKDTKGLYRILSKSGSLTINDHSNEAKNIIIEYEGHIGDVTLEINKKLISGIAVKDNHYIKISSNISSDNNTNLKLIVANKVKLRSVALESL